MKIPVSPATHHWRSSGWTLASCVQCKKQTTGRVKGTAVKDREKALCSDCAKTKGW